MALDNIFGAHQERIVSGLAMLAVVLTIGFIDDFFLTWLILGGIYMLAFYEASKLFDVNNNANYAYAVIIWLVAGIYPYADDLFVIAGVVFGAYTAFTQNRNLRLFLPFIYPTAGMLFTLSLYHEYGIMALLWLLLVVAFTDIGAYVVGKSMGKTLFCETSPNKTLEGVVGGIVVATLSGLIVGLYYVDISIALLISFLVALSSIFGDLFESYLKREAGVKDSGNVIPGHGGVLDRIDGYLFGSIIMLVMLRGLV